MATRPKISAGMRLAGDWKAYLSIARSVVAFNLCGRAICTLVVASMVAGAAQAQKSLNPPPAPIRGQAEAVPLEIPSLGDPLPPVPSMDTVLPNGVRPEDTGRMIDAESCNSWTESGIHSPTVSATRLAVPGKATSEYQKGCGAFKSKRFPSAEEHLRKALEVYPEYPAAWVVLGQVLESEQKNDDAKEACAKAEAFDPGYVAAYLCLAEFAAIDGDWANLAKISDHALAIDPIGNPYALYYAADAGLHFNQLSQAEMHAQAAVKLDQWHHLPELHLLLAQIYQAAGNVVGETVQLREYLKVAGNSTEASKARGMLAKLEAPPALPQASKDPVATEQSAK
jgi:tetratricopeptide (TPR) repeat protein